MKLVEILARELKEWPEVAYAAVQDNDHDKTIWYLEKDHKELRNNGEQWVCRSLFDLLISEPSQLADDHATAIVTREMWEAERAKLRKPKANAEGWIRHRGGKCPVEAGTLVDVRYRNGKVNERVAALNSCYVSGSMDGYKAYDWSHNGASLDIMAYRIHKPAEQSETVSEEYDPQPVSLELLAKSFDYCEPYEWRDRIRELDAQRAEVEELYQCQIIEITQERESLVQKLAGEGLALVEVVAQPAEDMSDPANWRKGDLITFVLDRKDSCFTNGKQYVFEGLDCYGSASVLADDEGDENGWAVEYFKWHSRPTR